MVQPSAVNPFPLWTVVDVIVGTPHNRSFYRAFGEVVEVIDQNRRKVRISKVFANEGGVYEVTEGSIVDIHIDNLH